MDFLWLQQLIIGHAIKHGLDKSSKWIVKWLFNIDPLLRSISISIEKTRGDLQIESADYLLRSSFGKNSKLVKLIKTNYRTNPKIVTAELCQSLINCGADFGNETEATVNKIISKFLEHFSLTLPESENVPISSSQTSEAILNRLSEISLKQDDILGAVASQAKKSVSLEPPAVLAIDSDAELASSKYKKDIDEAKILLDKEKFVTAKAIYEKLLNAFESDWQVPIMARFKVHNNLGACQAALGDRKSAAINFKLAFDILGKKSVIACKNRALASLFDDKPLEGLPFIDAAISLEPDNNDCINLKAMLLRAGGRLDEAIELYAEKGGR